MQERIGKYEIQEKIGEGGFGSVYRAFDPTVKRLVAVKVLSSATDPSLFTRFRNEAAAAGNLNHRNIVTIYEAGEHDGVPFIAMELLSGEDLEKALARGVKFTLAQKMTIMSEVANGFAKAHELGI